MLHNINFTTSRPRRSNKNVVPTEQELAVLEAHKGRGLSLADSVVEAGYDVDSRESATSKGHHIIKKLSSNERLQKAFEAQGIDVSLISKRIHEGLNATRMVKSGKELVEVDDLDTRHKYLDTAIDIIGAKAPKKVEVETKTFEQRLFEITVKDDRGKLPPLEIDGVVLTDDDDDL